MTLLCQHESFVAGQQEIGHWFFLVWWQACAAFQWQAGAARELAAGNDTFCACASSVKNNCVKKHNISRDVFHHDITLTFNDSFTWIQLPAFSSIIWYHLILPGIFPFRPLRGWRRGPVVFFQDSKVCASRRRLNPSWSLLLAVVRPRHQQESNHSF